MLARIRTFAFLPRVRVNLMLAAAAENHPFYHQVTRDFLSDSLKGHPRLPLVARFRHGVALAVLPPAFEEYYAGLEGSARRNHKKSARKGYAFKPIDSNRHLEDIAAIKKSAVVRQGRMPDSYLRGEVQRVENPASTSHLHDYPHFGVLRQERLASYCECLVAGEIALVQHILGHAQLQSDGVVPYLVIETVRHLLEHYPQVRYLAYGTFFGASPEMQRFKLKLGLAPHRVTWQEEPSCPEVGASPTSPSPATSGLAALAGDGRLMKLSLSRGLMLRPKKGAQVWYLPGPAHASLALAAMAQLWGPAGAVNAVARLARPGVSLYLVVEEGSAISWGWLTAAGREVAVGPIGTEPEHTNRGMATLGLRWALNQARYACRSRAWLKAPVEQPAVAKVAAKCGFEPA